MMGSPSPSSRAIGQELGFESCVDDTQDIEAGCAVEQYVQDVLENVTKVKGSQSLAVNKYAKEMEKATALTRNSSFIMRGSPGKRNQSVYSESIASTMTPFEIHQQVGRVIVKMGAELEEKRQQLERIQSNAKWWKKGIEADEFAQLQKENERLLAFNEHYANLISENEQQARKDRERYEYELEKYQTEKRILGNKLDRSMNEVSEKLAQQTECTEETKEEKKRLEQRLQKLQRKSKFLEACNKESDSRMENMRRASAQLGKQLELAKKQSLDNLEKSQELLNDKDATIEDLKSLLDSMNMQLSDLKVDSKVSKTLIENKEKEVQEKSDALEVALDEKHNWMREASKSACEKMFQQRETERLEKILERNRDWQKSQEIMYSYNDGSFNLNTNDKIKQTALDLIKVVKKASAKTMNRLVGPRKIRLNSFKSGKSATGVKRDEKAQIAVTSNFQTITMEYKLSDLRQLKLEETSEKYTHEDSQDIATDIFDQDFMIVGTAAPRMTCQLDNE